MSDRELLKEARHLIEMCKLIDKSGQCESMVEKIDKQLSISNIVCSYYTIFEWHGQGCTNRGVIGYYRTRKDAEKDLTDDYTQTIKEHKFGLIIEQFG